jgi:hypothetical protein
MKFPSFSDNYTRDVILMQGLSRKLLLSKKWLQTKKNKQMNHVAQRANNILQKPSPHSGMHWLRFPIRACIDSHPCIWAYMVSGGKQVRFISSKKWFYVIASSNDVIASKF